MAEAVALVWVCGPGFGCRAVRTSLAPCSVRDFIHHHFQDPDVPTECFFVKCNGALIDAGDAVQHGAVYSLEPRLRGGKGGFGSMLRALGAQIEKTTNREACRDLSGRRLRDVNHEKAMAEWVKQQAEREAEKEQKRLERLQRKLAEPRHCFASPSYLQQCHEMAERLEDSVLKGMQAASSKVVSAELGETRKRPNKSQTDRGASAGKRKCFWLGTDGLEAAEGSGSESSDDDSEEAPGTSGTSFPVPKNGSGDAATATKFPSSSQKAGVFSADCSSPAKPQSRVADRRDGIAEGSCARPGEVTAEEQRAERKVQAQTGKTQEETEAESRGPAGVEEEAAGTGLKEERGTKETAQGGRAAQAAPGEERGDVPLAKLEESQSGSTAVDQESLDLLAFSSAAEMEVLGLEKLKGALAALGLKCGGTLQERAARLFSVRGLAREQIAPALFAKPSKGKRK
ncbi:replication stress response regulator SDE2 [Sturnira hondurensis]|uniref:replication stress response regulator SDE2 n=1 Tax=Sturnira hondurensis TaxID=192404 RepID=UPI00187A0201|nr:replication stress response regulator SDE2 [Sturnira hondurensis]